MGGVVYCCSLPEKGAQPQACRKPQLPPPLSPEKQASRRQVWPQPGTLLTAPMPSAMTHHVGGGGHRGHPDVQSGCVTGLVTQPLWALAAHILVMEASADLRVAVQVLEATGKADNTGLAAVGPQVCLQGLQAWVPSCAPSTPQSETTTACASGSPSGACCSASSVQQGPS